MFLAVAIEPSFAAVEQLVVAQEDLADPLRQLGGDVSWTPAEQMRLVLRGCTNAERGDVARIRDSMRSVARNTAAPALTVEGLSFVPGVELPRMIMAKVVGEGLDELQRRVSGAIDAAGFAADEREWEPYVLVGRLRGSSERLRLQGVVDRFAATRFGTFTPRELVVVSTRLDGTHHRLGIEDRVAFGTGR